MSSELFTANGDAPFDGDKRLTNVVPVEYRTNHIKHDADARQLRLAPGDQVIVEARYGPTIAEVTGHLQRKVVDRDDLPRILRKAHQTDLQRAEENEDLEKEAHRFALERIRERELPMKLIRTQAMQDRSRLVFYFSADGRIDFRALVRDLAREFRTRIEMYQIGVRDGAQMIGGIGPCGRELCCSTFLERFEPISIRMAKQQGLTLSPNKISGMCGRLMCCLVYEQKVYRRMRGPLPDAGQQVRTEFGPATIDSVDVVNRRVTVISDDGAQKRSLPIDEVLLGASSPAGDDGGGEDDESLWDDGPPRKK